MKKLFFSFMLMLVSIPAALACEVCEEQQPEWLQSVVHGPGPKGPGDYIVMYIGIAIVIAVLILSIKLLVKPGEKRPDHVKYSILHSNDESYGER